MAGGSHREAHGLESCRAALQLRDLRPDACLLRAQRPELEYYACVVGTATAQVGLNPAREVPVCPDSSPRPCPTPAAAAKTNGGKPCTAPSPARYTVGSAPFLTLHGQRSQTGGVLTAAWTRGESFSSEEVCPGQRSKLGQLASVSFWPTGLPAFEPVAPSPGNASRFKTSQEAKPGQR